MYVQSNLIEWNALREIISMQFNYIFIYIYMAAIMSGASGMAFEKCRALC